MINSSSSSADIVTTERRSPSPDQQRDSYSSNNTNTKTSSSSPSMNRSTSSNRMDYRTHADHGAGGYSSYSSLSPYSKSRSLPHHVPNPEMMVPYCYDPYNPSVPCYRHPHQYSRIHHHHGNGYLRERKDSPTYPKQQHHQANNKNKSDEELASSLKDFHIPELPIGGHYQPSPYHNEKLFMGKELPTVPVVAFQQQQHWGEPRPSRSTNYNIEEERFFVAKSGATDPYNSMMKNKEEEEERVGVEKAAAPGETQLFNCSYCDELMRCTIEDALEHKAHCKQQRGKNFSSHAKRKFVDEASMIVDDDESMMFTTNKKFRHNKKNERFSSSLNSIGELPEVSKNNLLPVQVKEFVPPIRRGKTLATAKDQESLSDRQCFVRRDLVEIFCASKAEVAARHTKGAQKLHLGQVGIRCLFCYNKPAKQRGERAVCYPSSISRIYQTVADMQRFHFESCKCVPRQIRDIYKNLRTTRPRGVGSPQKYWIESAKAIGLYDSSEGIRMKDYDHHQSKQQQQQQHSNTATIMGRDDEVEEEPIVNNVNELDASMLLLLKNGHNHHHHRLDKSSSLSVDLLLSHSSFAAAAAGDYRHHNVDDNTSNYILSSTKVKTEQQDNINIDDDHIMTEAV